MAVVAGDNLEFHYKTLGLEPDARFEEVKRAYRALAKVWHPDRFAQMPHLQQQALETIQDINHAYAKIRQACQHHHRPASPPASASASAAQAPPSHAAAWRAGRFMFPQVMHMPAWAIALVAFVTLRVLVAHTLSIYALWPPALPRVPTTGGSATLPEMAQSSGALEQLLASLLADAPTTEVTQPDLPPASHLPASAIAPAEPAPRYFTVGSTKDEVLAVQGPPTLAEAQLWEYGGSRVYFRHGKVTRWEVWPRSPLKARLQPITAVAPRPSYITVGSTKDDVLAIQGTPSRFSDQVWEFGPSRLYFDGNQVVRWEEWPRFPLKVRLLPSAAVENVAPYFTVGSTKDEVLTIQGTPNRFTDRVWEYGQSRVYFDGDHVTRWDEWRGSPLKARPLPAEAG
jgi:outer membrane protein assembly factor BamE (lipoprotein component of BamABCDE complex)